jgi:hypothetical protein
MFSLVGLSGVGVHMAILSLVLLTGAAFAVAQSIAAIGAMTLEFHTQQPFYLSRPKAFRRALSHRLDPFPAYLRHRRRRQCRAGDL